MKKITLGLTGFLVAFATMAPAAHATLLLPLVAPGALEFPVLNTTQSNGSNPIGTLLGDTGAVPVLNTNNSKSATLMGSFRSVVYQEAGGTLDFYYQLSVASNSGASIGGLNVSNFANWLTYVGTASNVALLTSTGTVSPFIVERDAAPGDTVEGFYISPNVTPGTTSLTFAVSTNATNFTIGDASIIGTNSTSEDLSAFEPSSVPEPAGIVLFGTASALTAFFFRRRLTRKA